MHLSGWVYHISLWLSTQSFFLWLPSLVDSYTGVPVSFTSPCSPTGVLVFFAWTFLVGRVLVFCTGVLRCDGVVYRASTLISFDVVLAQPCSRALARSPPAAACLSLAISRSLARMYPSVTCRSPALPPLLARLQTSVACLSLLLSLSPARLSPSVVCCSSAKPYHC